MSTLRPATVAIHTPFPRMGGSQPVAEPIFQSATFELDAWDAEPEFSYTRYDGPNAAQLGATVAALEGGAFGRAFASGVAALHAAMSDLRPGDRVLVAADIYGGTTNLLRDVLAPLGIGHDSFDPRIPGDVAAKATSATRLAVFESPTNPTLRVCDVARVADECRASGIATLFDNTFASPAIQRPLAWGVDVVMHSTTKYLGGHSDATGGALVTNDPERAERIAAWAAATGACPSPFEAWLTLRGVRTLAVRMRAHGEGAMRVAAYLAGHPKVRSVNYPGLPSHPEHDLARRQMGDNFGGMLSAEFDSIATARRCVERMRLFRFAASLGGVESLVGHPARMSHAGLTPDERLAAGIPDELLRFSVGIEDPDDLVADLESALG